MSKQGMTTRIKRCFADAVREHRGVLGVFVSAGDPDIKTSQQILDQLVLNGADFIELGMAFSDPMADGPAIQASSKRALDAGIDLQKTLDMAAGFRAKYEDVPLILMGYYNPIYSYGRDAFIAAARTAGVDGLIIVDLPPEEDDELCDLARENDLDFIRLITPTSFETRLPLILDKASGFVYYVAVAGITGTKSADIDSIARATQQIRQATDLPIVVGFGINTAEQARAVSSSADGVVVGSAIVRQIEQLVADGKDKKSIDDIAIFCKNLSQALKRS